MYYMTMNLKFRSWSIGTNLAVSITYSNINCEATRCLKYHTFQIYWNFT